MGERNKRKNIINQKIVLLNRAVFCYRMNPSADGWACGSVVEHVPDKNGVEGSIPSTPTMLLEIKENELLKNHSSFKIGGAARYFVVAKSKEEIIEAIKFAKGKNLPYFVFGGGSNILFRDEGFEGVAIKIGNCPSAGGLKIENSSVNVGAGVLFSQLIIKSIDAGFIGFEWGVGIPGTVGGGVAGNCGAYGHSISENVESVSVLDEAGSAGWRIKKYSNKECEFCYRGSRFKNLGNAEVILEIEFKLAKAPPAGGKEKSKEEIKNILLNRRRKIPSHPSIGSIFKNIVIGGLRNKNEFLKLIPQEKIKTGKFPAAYLIEQCGLKGMNIGGAQISDLHANFIVNIGEGRAADVLELIKICKQKVREKFNIDLEEEIVVLPR